MFSSDNGNFTSRSSFNTANATPQQDLFQKHTDCYNFEAFQTEEHRQFVHEYWRQNASYLNGNTRLVLPPHLSDGHADQDIIQTNSLRSPVYWGRDVDDMINWDKVQEHFGYTKADTQLDPTLVSNTRYATVGPMGVMENEQQPEREGYAIHLWAVNLESKNTADYQTLITGNMTANGLDVEAVENCYFLRHYEVLQLIIRSTQAVLKPNQKGHIFSALLGAGCFLRAVDADLRERLLIQQHRAMSQLLAVYPNISFTLRIFSPNEFSPELVAAYQQLAKEYPLFKVGVGPDQGNVLKNIPTPTETNVTFVVNAGDPRSFIGNGMSRDPTVEGFLVANARGFNGQYRTTAFLHNWRFIPSLMDPSNWYRGD